MSPDPIVTTVAAWLWDQYGKALTDKALGNAREQWAKFRWQEAEAKYRARVRELHSTTRLLGHPKPITIEDIYTDVYVLDKPTAFWRFDLGELQAQPFEHEILRLPTERKSALRVAVTEKRLFILGKPGAGKTTFLKYLTIQACAGKISKTPIFVSLKEWADSGLELMPFLVQQFEICTFPDAQVFIEHLLENGDALVLFDGLDEVNQEGDQRAQMIRKLTDFAKRYREAQICLTCRIAATDYSFDQFIYLEIADFDQRQMRLFASKWYQDNRTKLARFLFEFGKPEHEGFRELARTPLLLALLCLAFDETLTFPPRRVDLYKEALDALLKKWDASRGIRRDEIYHNLSSVRKEQMLARLAAQNFEAGDYFMRQETLAGQIARYLEQLPVAKVGDAPDGEAVLKAIEAQHGVLVERAHGIYSFSHLTFQEYFTARYIVENAASGTLYRLIQNHLADDRWREVFLLAASLLDEADAFFEIFLNAIAGLVQADEPCVAMLHWAEEIALISHQPGPGARAVLLFAVLNSVRDAALISGHPSFIPLIDAISFACDHVRTFVIALNLDRAYAYLLDLNRAVDVALDFGLKLRTHDLRREWNMARSQALLMTQYLTANLLLIECLRLATVSNRKSIEARLLLLPGT